MPRPLRRLAAIALSGAAFAGTSALATVPPAPVVDVAGAGQALTVASDGEVRVTFTGRHGIYDKKLYLVAPDGADRLIFDGRSASVGDAVSLGAFARGQALAFRLAVVRPDGTDFDLYTGDGALNPRGFANARAMSFGARAALVSFEDLIGGGDLSFNDFGFRLENVLAGEVIANPLPGAAVFMLTALGGVAAWRRRG